jgi:hypothetical protein
VQLELEELKRFIESEKGLNRELDAENKRHESKIMHLEEMLRNEKDRVV